MIPTLLHRLHPPTALPLKGDDTGRFLPWMVAVMVFLAVLALAGALAASGAARKWDRALAGTATVQVLGLDDLPAAAADKQIVKVLDVLRAAPGVISAEPVDRAAAAELVKPWLGDAAQDLALPLPRLVDVTIDPLRLNGAELARQLTQAVPGARFDDHMRWVTGLRQLARAAGIGALAILGLIAGAAALTVVFATRAGLAVQRDVIEVVHLIGARDSYIANGFARHVLVLALRGALGGALLAAGGLIALSRIEMMPGLLPSLTLTPLDWGLIGLLPLVIALLAAFTARRTVMAALNRMP